MKKFLSKILISLVCVFSVIFSTGCSCTKRAEIYYDINIKSEDGSNLTQKLEVIVTVEKKFREPKDTPCYKKVEDEYVLIEDASGIYKCYTEEGKYFEKATYNREEKETIHEKVLMTNDITDKGKEVNAKSKTFAVPDKKQYSLVYTISIRNFSSWYQSAGGREDYYVKAIDETVLLGNMVKDKAIDKVKITLPEINTTIDGNSYYLVEDGETIKLKVEIKDLNNKDLELPKKGELKLDFDLVFRNVD